MYIGSVGAVAPCEVHLVNLFVEYICRVISWSIYVGEKKVVRCIGFYEDNVITGAPTLEIYHEYICRVYLGVYM